MKQSEVAAAIAANIALAKDVRDAADLITAAVAALQTAAEQIIAALEAAGGAVSPELEAAVRAMVDDGKSTLAMIEILNADAGKLSAVTDALLAGAKPQADLSA